LFKEKEFCIELRLKYLMDVVKVRRKESEANNGIKQPNLQLELILGGLFDKIEQNYWLAVEIHED
jgi:hypothetical protein